MKATAMLCPHGRIVAGTLDVGEEAERWLQPEPGFKLEVRETVRIEGCQVCRGR